MAEHTKAFDSYTNFAASVGIGTDNLSSYGTYNFSFITRNRMLLEAIYRSSWIIGAVVDMRADDMTQAGIDINSQMSPDQLEEFEETFEDLCIWQKLNEGLKYSGLYGSSVGVYLIDGQDFSTPLRLETVGKGQFKGILPLDRWQVTPSVGNLIKEYGPNMGMPKFYQVLADTVTPNLGNIHHSRLFRIDSIKLPHYQMIAENFWAESIVERIFDRLTAFDSTTASAAQLVFRAYLRTWKVPDLRNIIADGGPGLTNLTKNVQQIRRFQSIEGLTLVDGEDEMESASYGFEGLDDILTQFGQQLAGACEMPLVRLFGTSPKGMNATGESDLRNYYDGIRRKQKAQLRAPVKTILKLTHQSLYGKPLDPRTSFVFNPLWQVTEAEKSEIAERNGNTINNTFSNGIISRAVALKELRQASKVSGMFSNISDDDITDAENEPPLSEFAMTPDEEAKLMQGTNGKEETVSKA